MKMGAVCQIVGHKLQETFLISKSGDSYELDYGKVCGRCGEVNPPIPELKRLISSIL